METKEFVALVEQMRMAQKEYFKTRNRNVMQRSIMLEGLVDKEIKAFQEEEAKKDIQLDLFGY